MQGSTKTILIIDNEKDLSQFLAKRFRQLNYQVFLATNANDAFFIFKQKEPDLIILDILLPKIDGFSICRKIREKGKVPIVILTALNSISNRILGLKLGADDYIVKPFALKELELRVAKILKRYELQNNKRQEIFQFGNLTIDTVKKKIRKNKKKIILTPMEFRLLELLVKNAGKSISRNDILSNIWGYKYTQSLETRVIDVHIYRLRAKLEENPKNPDFILTVRGLGYKFQPFIF